LDNIIIFGCADNVFGGIGEHNMKPNVWILLEEQDFKMPRIQHSFQAI